MRVTVTSDFHGHVPPDVAPCDLLLIPGDCLLGVGAGRFGGKTWLMSFGEWLERQPATHIVGIAGNHDPVAEDFQWSIRNVLRWTYLQDEAVYVDNVKVFGIPWGHEGVTVIPPDTEILMTHRPARGILDRVGKEQTGSIELREQLRELHRLQMFVCGHIHEAYGSDGFQTAFGTWVYCANASYVDGYFQPRNAPITVTL